MTLALQNGIWIQAAPGNPVSQTWTQKYRLDMSAVSAWDFKTDGDTLALSGSTWHQANKGNATVLGFDGSTGLVINPANGSNLFSGGDTCPRIVATVDSLCGGDWSPDTQTVSIILRATGSVQIAADFDSYGCVMTNGSGSLSSPNGNFLKGGPLWVSGKKFDVSDGSEFLSTVTGLDANAIEHTIYPGGVCRTRGGIFNWSGTPSANVPTPGDNTNWTTIHADAIWNENNRSVDSPAKWSVGATINADNWSVGPFSFEVSSGTGLVATFLEIIVLRLE